MRKDFRMFEKNRKYCICSEPEKIGKVRPQTEEEHLKRRKTFSVMKEAYYNRRDKSITWNQFQKLYKENK